MIMPVRADETPVQATAIVTFDLPIRIQVPDEHDFVVQNHLGSCHLKFIERPAPARADGMGGQGIDDGKGTFLRSTASLQFKLAIAEQMPLSREAAESVEARLKSTAWNALQQFLSSYAYVAHHLDALILTNPEAWTLDLIDSKTGRPVEGFPKTRGHHLHGPIRPKPTLTPIGLAQLRALLEPGASVELPDRLLLRAETEVTLLGDLDHAILDTASALEIFIDQLVEREMHYAPSPELVQKLNRGVYSAYNEVLRVLGRPSLKDSHPPSPPDDQALPFELLEFIVSVRNNVIHRGVRQFTLEGLSSKRYQSPYLERHRRFEGTIIDSAGDVLDMIRGGRWIIGWIRSSAPPR